MRLNRFLIVCVVLAAFGLNATAQSLEPRGGSMPLSADNGAFVHVTSISNITSSTSILVSEDATSTSPLTDKNPGAVVFLTHNVSLSSATETSPFGVFYYNNYWRLFNQDFAALSVGEAFNVQVQGKGDNVFIHTASALNTTGHITVIDHPLTNGNASALLSVTPTWTGAYNPHFIGVYYVNSKWTIFNQDSAAMPVGAAFNVQVLENPATDFTHTASAGNIVSTSKTDIDNVLLNGNPNAQFIVTQNWSLSGTYNNNPIGVEYDITSTHWRIINTNGSTMPIGAGFNIHVSHSNDTYGDGVLFNGGFEAPGATAATAIKWNTTYAAAGSKRACNKYAPKSPVTKLFSSTGECAYLLKGGAGSKMTQTVTAHVTPGTYNTVDILGKFKAYQAVGLTVKATVKLSNGQIQTFSIPPRQLRGTYDWKVAYGQLLLLPGVSVNKLTLTIAITGGSVYIDDIRSAFYNSAP